jgi:Tfp pilus assembly protein PilO
MDYQILFNIVSGVLLLGLGWWGNQLWQAAKDLRDDLSKLREELPKTYITKNDFKESVDELKTMLFRIETKLDRKQDKE